MKTTKTTGNGKHETPPPTVATDPALLDTLKAISSTLTRLADTGAEIALLLRRDDAHFVPTERVLDNPPPYLASPAQHLAAEREKFRLALETIAKIGAGPGPTTTARNLARQALGKDLDE
jgi:hypothetical protein